MINKKLRGCIKTSLFFWKRVLIRALIAVACIVAEQSGFARAADETRGAVVGNTGSSIFNQVGISPRLGEQLPLDVEFADSDGKNIRLRDCFADRPVILHLVYYECPMLCKLSADGLLRTLSTLSLKPGKDFSIVTLSFDPREGPELSAKARELAIARCGQEAVKTGWHFLTGNQAAITAITEAVGFRYVYDDKISQYAHASGIFVLTPEGTISRYLSGVNFSPRDLRFALIDASDGKIGTAVDQALMLCYMYDPAVGKYGFAIMTVMRVSGLATVIGLGAAIYTMIRRERRRNTVSQAVPDTAQPINSPSEPDLALQTNIDS
jgi:protein SCO1/2